MPNTIPLFCVCFSFKMKINCLKLIFLILLEKLRCKDHKLNTIRILKNAPGNLKSRCIFYQID